ncbi:MAG: Abi family protein [Oceanibaculum sp.]
MRVFRQPQFDYSESELDNLERTLSSERLKKYLQMASGDRAKAIRLYERNSELSACLYIPMQGVEIALRNTVSNVLQQDFRRADWYDSPSLNLQRPQQDALSKAKANLTRQGKPHDPDRIVAELTFGFWVGLFGKAYSQFNLWNQHLHKAFPNASLQRKACHSELDKVRLLRNRIAHHEPILNRDLRADHSRLILIADWICSDTSRWISCSSRFDTIHKNGWARNLIKALGL